MAHLYKSAARGENSSGRRQGWRTAVVSKVGLWRQKFRVMCFPATGRGQDGRVDEKGRDSRRDARQDAEHRESRWERVERRDYTVEWSGRFTKMRYLPSFDKRL